MMNDMSKQARFIVFEAADHRFAIPLDQVLRVVSYVPETSRGLAQLGLFQIGQHMIKILDLQEWFSSGSQPQAKKTLFLIIIKSPQGELCGIPVETLPDSIELPLESINLLPQSNFEPKVFEIARYAAVISQEQIKTVIFLLDVDQFMHLSRNTLPSVGYLAKLPEANLNLT
jgi:chemotaxis signal transduction protein